MIGSHFPGHMAKARRRLKELLPVLDLGIVVLDARIPRSSLGQGLAELMPGRPLVYALNKADLADPEKTGRWREHLEAAVAVDARTGEGISELLALCLKRGRRPHKYERPLRLAVIGIPNVGKSSLLNRLAGRRAATVGDRPGITRAPQWIKAHRGLEVLDLPGLLAPRLGDPATVLLLALVAAIEDDLVGREKLAREAMALLEDRYPGRLAARYGIALTGDPEADLAALGRARGCLLSGDRVDMERAAALLLADLRAGRLGRLTLEDPF
ncbi:MAG: ribosome biogenesis GTPase YlqF [Firmicutes bacterium]|nr:ribosome biogenesis GTPase YlqF [Bacillota bacterium]